MRILVVTPFMWSGAGKAITTLAAGLKSSGHDIEVVSSGTSNGFADWPCYVNDLRERGIPYHAIDFFDRRPESFWPSVARLGRVAADFGPDVYHAHSGAAAFGALAVGGAPVIATLHSWNPDRPAWMNTMDVWALNQCRRVICVSESYREYLIDQGLRKDISSTIYLGIEADRIGRLASAATENPLDGRKYFCYLGRLESRKRQLLLVDVLARLPDDWSLLLIGPEGETGYAARVFQRAEESGVGARLKWTGPVDNPYPLIRDAKCFVSASSDEGLGLSVLEAMAMGTPVIATIARGIVDFVRHRRNGLIADATPFALAEQIRHLETSPSLGRELADRASAMVLSVFSWSRALNGYRSVFEEVLKLERGFPENYHETNTDLPLFPPSAFCEGSRTDTHPIS